MPASPSHPPRSAAARRRKPTNTGPGGLVPHEGSERLSGLLREQARLSAAVAKKRDELERTSHKFEEVAREVATRVRPLADEHLRLDAEIHAVFAELLGRPKLSKRARAAVRRVYRELQEGGTLTDRAEADPVAPPPTDAPEADGPFPFEPDWQDAPSASKPTGTHGATIRELFRKLANALHPDKVQEAKEKETRTEAMKEVTRAYQEGDLARLLELERRHAQGEMPAGDEEDLVLARCRSIERLNAALTVQLRDLRRELRELRDQPIGELLRGRRRNGTSPEAALDELVAEAEADVAQFRDLLAFVQRFRDGKMSLEEFLAGPEGPPDEDEEALDEMLFEALSFMAESFAAQAPRGTKKKRRGNRR